MQKLEIKSEYPILGMIKLKKGTLTAYFDKDVSDTYEVTPQLWEDYKSECYLTAFQLESISEFWEVKPTQSKMIELFKTKEFKKYQKFGTFTYKINTEEPYQVNTTFYDEEGNVIENETTNTCNTGDVVITGLGGEQYVLKMSTFLNRYNTINETECEAKGQCVAYQYKGKYMEFIAPWGTTMIVKEGDFLACANVDEITEVYRIQEKEFYKTYKPYKENH